MLFFRDQPIAPEQHLAPAAWFGEIDEPHPVFGNRDRNAWSTIIESKGRVEDSEHYWHTDVTYQACPSMGSILIAHKIPEVGGDTLFADMCAAFEALSSPMQSFLCGLAASHSFERGWDNTIRTRVSGDQRMLDLNRAFPLMTHPVGRTHPEAGRKALYVNEYYTSHINELSAIGVCCNCY